MSTHTRCQRLCRRSAIPVFPVSPTHQYWPEWIDFPSLSTPRPLRHRWPWLTWPTQVDLPIKYKHACRWPAYWNCNGQVLSRLKLSMLHIRVSRGRGATGSRGSVDPPLFVRISCCINAADNTFKLSDQQICDRKCHLNSLGRICRC